MSRTEWTMLITDAIKDRMIRCEEHKISHIIKSERMNSIYNSLTILGIAIGPAISVISGMEGDKLTGVIAGLGILSGVVVSVIKFGKFDETAIKHKNAADGYAELEYEIRNQLLLEEKDRLSAKDYMEWSQNKFTSLFASSPLLGIESYKVHDNNNVYNFVRRITESRSPVKTRRGAKIHVIQTEEDDQNTSPKDSGEIPLKTVTFNKHPATTVFSDRMLQYELERFRRP
jgi:hypothetical protein